MACKLSCVNHFRFFNKVDRCFSSFYCWYTRYSLLAFQYDFIPFCSSLLMFSCFSSSYTQAYTLRLYERTMESLGSHSIWTSGSKCSAATLACTAHCLYKEISCKQCWRGFFIEPCDIYERSFAAVDLIIIFLVRSLLKLRLLFLNFSFRFMLPLIFDSFRLCSIATFVSSFILP